jgi:hypothetical protein
MRSLVNKRQDPVATPIHFLLPLFIPYRFHTFLSQIRFEVYIYIHMHLVECTLEIIYKKLPYS